MEEISKQKFNERKFKSLIINALKAKPAGATIADIVVGTGLPVDWVEYCTRKLLSDFPCRLRTNQYGELIYIFDLHKKKKSFTHLLLSLVQPGSRFHKAYRKQKFLYQTLSYIFGETQKGKDRLLIEKIILNYIRHNNGEIVVAEIVQITGWSIYQAETQAAQLLANYHGEVEVTDEGVIIYRFEDLAHIDMLSKEIMESLKIWERPLHERKMNDNDEETNQKLEKLNKRNLVASFLTSFIGGGLLFSQHAGILGNLLLFGSASLLSFSTFFFLIPAFRKFFVYLENEKIRVKNVETFMLKGIFNRINSQIFPEKDLKKLIQESKPIQHYHYWWNRIIPSSVFEYSFILTSTYHRELLLEKKAIELEADIHVDQNGDIYYDFTRLNQELNTIAKKRT